mmetsp:Transcript_10998/g.17682  ORF Transcript_10998/g.17682 Transcript_10998/m.17682 type:complete len:153 (-) Transcript_10998:870-1328(-)
MQLILRGTRRCCIMVSVADDAGQGEHQLWCPSSSFFFLLLLLPCSSSSSFFFFFTSCSSFCVVIHDFITISSWPFLDLFIVVHYLLVKTWFSLVLRTKKATQLLLTCLSIVYIYIYIFSFPSFFQTSISLIVHLPYNKRVGHDCSTFPPTAR